MQSVDTLVLTPALESTLADVEFQLHSLGEAMRTQNVDGIDVHATQLHEALARAVDHFANAARSGSVPPPLRQRLMHASGQVAAQRESLARATAALDRAMDALMPRERASSLYSAMGNAERPLRSSGMIQA